MQAGQSVYLDFVQKNCIKNTAKQNDINSRWFNIVLGVDGQIVELANTATVTLNITRSDGKKNSYIGAINDNTVTVFLSSWAVELEGILECDVSVMEQNQRLTTMPFQIEVVQACCTTDDIKDADSEDVLTNLYTLLQKYEGYDLDNMTDKLEQIETIVNNLSKQIMIETITIEPDEWEFNGLVNKYVYTKNNDSVTDKTYIVVEVPNELQDVEIESNNGYYQVTARVISERAVNLLLIFFKGG